MTTTGIVAKLASRKALDIGIAAPDCNKPDWMGLDQVLNRNDLI